MHVVRVAMCVSLLGLIHNDSVMKRYTTHDNIQTIGKKGRDHIPHQTRPPNKDAYIISMAERSKQSTLCVKTSRETHFEFVNAFFSLLLGGLLHRYCTVFIFKSLFEHDIIAPHTQLLSLLLLEFLSFCFF